MATNAHDTAVGDLPDELILDVLARLPDPVDLLHCAATCIRWLRLLASDDASFLRRASVLLEKHNDSLLLGAFYQNDFLKPGSATRFNIDCPPQFWRLDDLARPGVYSMHDGTFNYAKPLASRAGLLLLRLMPAPLDYRKLHLAVWHPILGGVHIVPPPLVHLHPPFLGRDLTGYALLTGYGGEGLDNNRQRRLAFRVLFTTVRLDGVVCAYSYSSATESWSAPTMCPLQVRNLTMSGPRAGVVDGRGTTHGLYRDAVYFYTLDVSADAAHGYLTKIPILVVGYYRREQLWMQPPFPCIAQGGKLAFVLVTPPDIYICHKRNEDDNNEEWIDYEVPISQMRCESFKFIGFAESRGALLVKSDSGLFCLDLETKELELELIRGSGYTTYPSQVCPNSMCEGYDSCIRCAYNNCVLYEMDWSSYLLHISAWSPRGLTK